MTETNRSLAGFQAAFSDYLLAAELPTPARLNPWLARTDENESATTRTDLGLRVYRNNVIYSLTQALAAQFPVVHKLVGSDFFGALARDYVQQQPPIDAALTYYGHLFASFVASVPACEPLPYLADVATLEFYCQRALHAADDPVLNAEQLSAVPHERLDDVGITLHSSAYLFASDYPVARIWAANLEDSDAEIRLDAQTRHYLLVYRRKLQVQVITLQPAAYLLLEQLYVGESLEQACACVLEQLELDPTELAPLLGYLLGLEVFSRVHLQTAKEHP